MILMDCILKQSCMTWCANLAIPLCLGRQMIGKDNPPPMQRNTACRIKVAFYIALYPTV